MATRRKKLIILLSLTGLVIVAFFGIKYATERFYQSAYPKGYENTVQKYSSEYQIDENILFAIIKTESDFEPDVTSNVGARGLTQIMEDTFNWIKSKLKDSNRVYDDMYNEEQNIRYGAFLIGYLYSEFQSYDTAVAAYHAGRTATRGWLKNPEYSKDGVNLDKIPISDTAHYVSKVMKSYRIYEKLYK